MGLQVQSLVLTIFVTGYLCPALSASTSVSPLNVTTQEAATTDAIGGGSEKTTQATNGAMSTEMTTGTSTGLQSSSTASSTTPPTSTAASTTSTVTSSATTTTMTTTTTTMPTSTSSIEITASTTSRPSSGVASSTQSTIPSSTLMSSTTEMSKTTTNGMATTTTVESSTIQYPRMCYGCADNVTDGDCGKKQSENSVNVTCHMNSTHCVVVGDSSGNIERRCSQSTDACGSDNGCWYTELNWRWCCNLKGDLCNNDEIHIYKCTGYSLKISPKIVLFMALIFCIYNS